MNDRWGFTFPLEGVPLPAHREVLQEAEASGYTDAWTMEVDGTDAFVPAGLGAAWTDDLRIGTAIANVFTRGPALLAMEATAVAEVAPDRFCLGIGSSSPAIVETWNGRKLHRPLEKVRETVAFVRAAMSGEKASSEALGARGFRLSRRFAPPPPIFIGALREKMLQLAGTVGDGVILNWLSPADVPKAVAVVKDAARAAGRDPESIEIACRIFVMLDADEGVERFVTRRVAAGYLSTPVYGAFHEWLGRGEQLRPMLDAWREGDRKAAVELIPEQVIQDLFVLGDRRACINKVEEYVRSGITVPILSFLPAALDPKELGQRSIAMLKALAPQ